MDQFSVDQLFNQVDFFLGDSIMRRTVTNMGMDHSFKSGNKICVDLCVGGQTVLNLKRRLRFSESDNSMWHFKAQNATLVLMIGTNDILKGTNMKSFKKALQWMIKDLMKMGVRRLLMCTIPPLYKYDVSSINSNIELCSKMPNVHLVDIYNAFIENKENLLERFVHKNSFNIFSF